MTDGMKKMIEQERKIPDYSMQVMDSILQILDFALATGDLKEVIIARHELRSLIEQDEQKSDKTKVEAYYRWANGENWQAC